MTSCQNNASTSKQTDQLITAAKINASSTEQIAAASERNATAAENFSGSASHINQGVGDAVKKLNLQAHASKTIAEQARKSLLASFRSDRAWIGVQHFQLLHYDPGVPVEFTYDLVNSGKTPALNVRLDVRGDHFFRRIFERTANERSN